MIEKINKFSTVLFAVTTMLCLISAGCCKQTKVAKDSPFRFVPLKCNTIAVVDAKKLCKIDAVKKQIEKNENEPVVKELEAAGAGWDNIKTVCLAMASPIDFSNENDQLPLPETMFLFSTHKKVNMNKLIPIFEKEIKKGISEEKIGSHVVYNMESYKKHDVVLTQLSNNIVAVGTINLIKGAIDLSNGKGGSIAKNREFMKYTNNTHRNDLFWIAALIKKESLAGLGEDFPAINKGLIAANYANDLLKINGNIKCETNEDAQKLLATAQILTGIILMRPNSGVKAEDIVLNTDKNQLNITISLTKQVLENLTKSSRPTHTK